jgi:membrane protein
MKVKTGGMPTRVRLRQIRHRHLAIPKLHQVEMGFVVRFWRLLRLTSLSLYRDGAFGTAKGAAYSSLLAFFPVLTTVATILVQANADATARTVARLLYDVVPPGTEDVVRALFNVHGRRPVVLVASAVILAAWAGSGVMISLMEGFRAAYRIKNTRSFVRERIIAMALVVGSAVPALGSSALIVVNNRARVSALEWMGLLSRDADVRTLVQILGQVLSFLIAAGGIVFIATLVYYFAPNRKQQFWQLVPGAMVATVLWLLSTLGFGAYVRYVTNYNLLYGSVGAGLALLVWSYLLAVIAFFGCEFNAVRERSETDRLEHEHAHVQPQ